MSFSYASTNAASSSLSWVRLRLGDTSSGSARFQDEEINAMVSVEGNKYLGAAVLAESAAALYATRVDKTVGRLSISYQQASDHFTRLAIRLRHELNMRAAPYAGGISVADKDAVEADTDRVQPAFSMGQFDDPAVGIDVDLSTGA